MWSTSLARASLHHLHGLWSGRVLPLSLDCMYSASPRDQWPRRTHTLGSCQWYNAGAPNPGTSRDARLGKKGPLGPNSFPILSQLTRLRRGSSRKTSGELCELCQASGQARSSDSAKLQGAPVSACSRRMGEEGCIRQWNPSINEHRRSVTWYVTAARLLLPPIFAASQSSIQSNLARRASSSSTASAL